METGIISLALAGVAGVISALNFLNTISVRRSLEQDKLAKSSDVNSDLNLIKTDISDLYRKIEDQEYEINESKTQIAVLNSQTNSFIKELGKLGDKLDQWRNDE